jgi:transposase
MAPGNRKDPQNYKSSDSQYSLMEFMREFPDDDACLEWLWRNRFSPRGDTAYCPKCETQRIHRRYGTSQQRQSWTCIHCGHHLHPKAGTIFHKSSTSLHLWFYAMYLMTSTRCGISAKQLERELGVTYKTAWRMAKLIRQELMVQEDEPFGGEVEMDETYVGGKRRGDKRGRPSEDSHKTPVFGMVQRRGRVAAVPDHNVKAKTLMPQVRKRVLPSSVVYTDELRSYDGLKCRGYRHNRIHHAEQICVSGTVHTNTIEGFWSLTKRGINGVYHAVSAKHLQGYLNEYAFRYNNRGKDGDQFKKLLLRAALSL